MSEAPTATIGREVPLDDAGIEPARSRHAGRRSAVALTRSLAVVGTPTGALVAVDRTTGERRWTATEGTGSVVAATPFAGGVAVGERGPAGEVRWHDAATGAVRWRHETAAEVGAPARDARFQLPYIAALDAGDNRLYAAARRYERDGDGRTFESTVYAFTPDGGVDWTHRTDASPIAVDADGDRVAVAYNRCPGGYDHGLVVLDVATGAAEWHWDPGTPGDRRVGDVSLLQDGAAVASHGDYRGYRLGPGGRERWRAALATPTAVGDERLYAYPNHVAATDRGVVFVTGNTYPEEGRETDGLHPDEHTAFGYAPDGERRWTASVGGFAGAVGADGDRLAIPGAQHFRRRDPDAHGIQVVDAATGPVTTVGTDGVVTAAAVDGVATATAEGTATAAGAEETDGAAGSAGTDATGTDEAPPRATVAAVEEPVVYHDEGTERGTYRLHLLRPGASGSDDLP